MNFTAHNICLNDGKRTMDEGPALCEKQQCKAILRTMDTIWREPDRARVRVVDLGCLEGGYTVELRGTDTRH